MKYLKQLPILVAMACCQTHALSCPGDLNGNQSIDTSDLLKLLSDWGSSESAADLDGSGLVDAGDVLLILNSWGDCPDPPGQCEGYGVSFLDGQGYLYSHVSLGTVCYMCTGPGFNGCTPNFTLQGEFYVMPVNIEFGDAYDFGIQCGPNVIVTGLVDESTSCWLNPSCSDGLQNGGETDIDCGWP